MLRALNEPTGCKKQVPKAKCEETPKRVKPVADFTLPK